MPRPMIGMTVCSGIGAPEVSAPWIDWRYQSEIEPFPCAVLRERFPDAVQLGDMTKFQEWPDATVDVLCGGTPCQSFSVAGLRRGLADPRGNLMLTFLAIARRYRPRWVVWENVPGVLSSNEGRDFGAFLGGLGKCGYGWAYRVLDAQYVRTPGHPWAVPQRRRRVFVVGHLGDWRPAGAVLLEPEGLQGHPPPRRKAGQRFATRVAHGLGDGRRASETGTDREDIRERQREPESPVFEGGAACDPGDDIAGMGAAASAQAEVAPTVPSRSTGGGGLGTDCDCDGGLIASTGDVAHCLNAGGFDASEDGTGRSTPLVPVAFTAKDYGGDAVEGVSPTLRAGGHAGSHANAGVMPAIATPYAVRRLTPRECERLQGFPNDWTLIPWRGKPADRCPDGPRYKALGNSWAVNCGQFVFDRIRAVEDMMQEPA